MHVAVWQVQRHQQEMPERLPNAMDDDCRLALRWHPVGLPLVGFRHPQGPQGAPTRSIAATIFGVLSHTSRTLSPFAMRP
jgi:hypothetical protein